jgi:hypothetical protein
MNLQEDINRIQQMMGIISESRDVDEKVKDIIINASDYDSFIEALKVKYGKIIPLYHATTIENSKKIDEEGFKLVHGKNYKSYSREPFLYFQIGHSDYVSSERNVLYRLDVPLEFMWNAEPDMDSFYASDEDLVKAGVVSDISDIDDFEDETDSETNNLIRYFVDCGMTLDGMEIIIRDIQDEGDIFKGLTPIKVKG